MYAFYHFLDDVVNAHVWTKNNNICIVLFKSDLE